MRTLISLILTVFLVVGTSPAQAQQSNWDAPGPYQVRIALYPEHTILYPVPLTGRRAVVLWGNGTGSSPGVYARLLMHLASHGFIVAAANTPLAETGQEMLAGIDLLERLDDDPASVFHEHVDLASIGATGHSQGGAGAINAGVDPRVDATAPIQPNPLGVALLLRGPSLVMAGQHDVIALPLTVQLIYATAVSVPAIYAERAGATHLEPLDTGGGYRGVTTAWFRYKLVGDQRAAADFVGPDCGICVDPAWSDVRRNALASHPS